MMRIALLGFGSVGRGIARAILAKGLNITVTGLADSRSGIIDAGGIDLAAALARKEQGGPCGNQSISPMDVVEKAEYDILVEVTPTDVETAEPALGHIRGALRRGKHVVTSNKGPIALAYPELRALAEANGVLLKYEATVCGAIPLIHAMQEGIAGNTITRICGVFNGTCNYILTRMAAEGLTYEQALAEARDLGYAEATTSKGSTQASNWSSLQIPSFIWRPRSTTSRGPGSTFSRLRPCSWQKTRTALSGSSARSSPRPGCCGYRRGLSRKSTPLSSKERSTPSPWRRISPGISRSSGRVQVPPRPPAP